MSAPIGVGDLVVVVRSTHACTDDTLGKIFTVLEILSVDQGAHCGRCLRTIIPPGTAFATFNFERGGAPISWLRRIPPLAELEPTMHAETVEA